jgi:signal transduction histidine kinase/putative methionine-R-sulfoxide reductase with GAF domain
MTAPAATTVRRPLFRKYVGLFVAVVAVALLANGALEIWFSYQEHKASLIRIQREQAEAAAAKIGQFVKEIENQLGWTTQLPWSASTVEQRRFDGLRLLRQVPAVTELSMVDAKGKEQLRVSRLAMDVVGSGIDVSSEPKFTEAMARKVYYGPVYFRRESEPYMTLALAGTRRDAGVSIAEVNLKLIWEVISKIKVGERGYAYVVDAQGRLIAHPDISLVLRNTDLSGLQQVKAARAGQAGDPEQVQVAENAQGRSMLTAHAPVAPLGWLVFAEMPLDEAYAPLYASIRRTGVLMLGALVLAVFAGFFLARKMIVPIRTLRAGAERIGGGDLTQRIAVKTGDELEALAHQFNDMAGRLQESYADLENKVDLRTAELSESLMQQTATADVLKVISRSVFDLQPVLDTLVESASRLCRTDRALLHRLIDGKYRISATCGVSPEFKEFLEKHPIDPGSMNTVVGRTAMERQIIHYEDVLNDERFSWPESQRIGNLRTMLGVPLLRNGEPIGVMAIHRTWVEPFSQREIDLMTTFADQAVIAIENTRLFEEVQKRTRELQESLDYQTATGEVLNVISRSPSQIQPVLDTIVETASRLCEGYDAAILLRQGDQLEVAAHRGPIPIDFRTMLIGRGWVTGRAVTDRKPVHVHDLAAAGDEFPEGKAIASRLGFRTTLATPLLRENLAIGAIMVRRREVRPFSDKQVAVLQTFADQAVIAIENVRLFEEVQARTRELQEALEYQTATTDVLGVISRSPSQLEPVFGAIIGTAARLCEAEYALLYRLKDGMYHVAAANNVDAAFVSYAVKHPLAPGRGSLTGRTAVENRTVHIPDCLADPEYTVVERQKVGKYRTALGVPLLRNGVTIGVIALMRSVVKPFAEKQIDLVTTFADQAVIAIENARLFEEVQARTRELSESLQQQTATSEVLKVISNSLTDIQPVFDAIVQSGLKLFSGAAVSIALPDGGQVKAVAVAESDPARAEAWWRRFPFPLTRDYMHGRALLDCRMVDIPDVEGAPAELAVGKQNFLESGYRAITIMPMMRGDAAIGVLSVVRIEPGPLSDKELATLQSFADQAVIAIENTRLFEEVQARTRELARSVEELRALGEVSRAVNSTLDLETVLSTIVAKAVQLSGTEAGAIYVYSKWRQKFRLRATYGMSDDLIEAIRSHAGQLGDTALGEAVARRAPLQIADMRDEPPSAVREIILEAGYRGVLIVPLLRPSGVVGALVVRRREPGEFPKATVDLLMTFAEQSVLAIQNARLFGEIEEKGRQLEIASRHKSQFLANMSHELRTPLNSVLGFTEMLADGLYGALPERAKAALVKVQNNGRHLLGLINDVLDLSKIEAGQLTLALEDYSVTQIVNSVVTSTESLARGKGLALTAEVAPGLPIGRGDERRLTQVLFNLVGNAIKFTDAGSVDISARAVDGTFELTVRDTGPGIAPEDHERIFEEFQQIDSSSTREKGGTGLGLAISRRIVEMHGGAITVQSQLGQGSTFRIVVPVRAEEQREAA